MSDFGFASIVRGLDSVLVTKVQGFSPRWATPEVISEGDRNTREADVYAFGMVVIEVGRLSGAEGSTVGLTSYTVQGFYRKVSV